MSLNPGSRLGPYEITAQIGAGGMGEVYKAKDTKLGRMVAVKVLPPHLAQDSQALARFEREARSLASLQHPGILAIHDFGHEGDIAYAVMELLEGETLREALMRGALPAKRGADVASQVAHALAAAHEKGLVHRDLKPDNVFLLKDGRVKLLDFGLAKKLDLPKPDDVSTVATHMAAPTQKGLLLGTLGYMSPEQIRGEEADTRSDLFSFGVMAFEIFTGRRAFRAPTTVEVLAAILTVDPLADADARAALQPGLDRIIARCLEKDPERRFQSAKDLAFALEGTGTTAALSLPSLPIHLDASLAPANEMPKSPLSISRGLRGLLMGLGLGVVVCVGLLLALAPFLGSKPTLPILRPLSGSGRESLPSASPDGKTVAFMTEENGATRIWLLQIVSGNQTVLTAGPSDDFPQISPDGTEILFRRRNGKSWDLFRVPAVGGAPTRVAYGIQHGAWASDGKRVLLLRSLSENPARTEVSVANRDGSDEQNLAEIAERFLPPRCSPDGKRMVLVPIPQTAGAPQNLHLLGLDGLEHRVVPAFRPIGRVSIPTWLDAQTLLYAQARSAGGALPGQSAQLIRHPLRWGHAEALMWLPDRCQSVDRIGSDGLILDALPQHQGLRDVPLEGGAPTWLTRGGSTDRQPTVSANGEWVAFSSNRSGNLDLWSVSLKTHEVRRLTDDAGDDWDPAFSPDGSKLLWSSNRSGHFEIWMAEADGNAAKRISTYETDAENPHITADGTWIYHASGNPGSPGLWRLHPDGKGPERVVAGFTSVPVLNPDGHFAAYNREGEISGLRFVSLPDGKELDLPFINGLRPAWSPDGRMIAYILADGRGGVGVWAQPFDPRSNRSVQPRLLYLDPEWPVESFAFTPDGKHLIVSAADPAKGLVLATGVPGLTR